METNKTRVRRIPNPVPKITHPLGKNWYNPPEESLQFFQCVHGGEMFVRVVGGEGIERMSRYDFSQPSGVYEGKMWIKRGFIAWFSPSDDPDKCSTQLAKIIK